MTTPRTRIKSLCAFRELEFSRSPEPGSPGPGSPGPGDPGSGDPGSGDPGSGDPGSGDPGSGGSGDPGSGGSGGSEEGPLNSWRRIPAEDIDFKPTEEYLERNVALPVLGRFPGVVGARGGTLTFKIGLGGTEDGTAINRNPMMDGYLDLLFGGSCLKRMEDGGATSVSAPGASPLEFLKVNSLDGFHSEMPIGIVLNGSVVIRPVIDIDPVTNTLQVVPPLPSPVVAGTRVYAPVVYTPEDATPGTLSFVFVGDGYGYTLRGCKAAPPKITITSRGRVLLEFSFQVNDWSEEVPEGELPYMHIAKPIIARASPCYFFPDDVETITLPTLAVTEASVDFGITVSPMNDIGGAQGRSGFAATDAKPVLTFKPFYDSQFRQIYRRGDLYTTVLQIGSEEARSVAVLFGQGQIAAYPSEVDANGFVAHDMKVQAVVKDRDSTCGLMFF